MKSPSGVVLLLLLCNEQLTSSFIAAAVCSALSPGKYIIQSEFSGKVMRVQDGSREVGAKIVQWGAGSIGSEWEFEEMEENHYHVFNTNSGLALNVPGGSSFDGVQLDQQPESAASTSDAWCFERVVGATDVYYIKNLRTQKLVGLSQSTLVNGARIDQYIPFKGITQRWKLTRAPTISANSQAPPAPVPNGFGQECASLPEDKQYILQSQFSDKVIRVESGSTSPTARTVQWDNDGSIGATWEFKRTVSSYYQIVNTHSELRLDVKDVNTVASRRSLLLNGLLSFSFLRPSPPPPRPPAAPPPTPAPTPATRPAPTTPIARQKASPGPLLEEDTTVNTPIEDNWCFAKIEDSEDTYYIVNRVSGNVVELGQKSTMNDIEVQQNNYLGSSTQRWKVVPFLSTSTSINQPTVSTLSPMVRTPSPTLAPSREPTPPSPTPNRVGGRQCSWVEEGEYEIENIFSGMVMRVQSGSTRSGADIEQWSDNGSAGSRWEIRKATTSNYYRFVNKRSGLAMSLPGGILGDDLEQQSIRGSWDQIWCIVEVNGSADRVYIVSASDGEAAGLELLLRSNGIDIEHKRLGLGFAQEWQLRQIVQPTSQPTGAPTSQPTRNPPIVLCTSVRVCYGGSISPEDVDALWTDHQADDFVESIELSEQGPFTAKLSSEVELKVTDIYGRPSTCVANVTIQPCTGQIQPICNDITLCGGSDDVLTPELVGSRSVVPSLLVRSVELDNIGPFPTDTVTSVTYIVTDISGERSTCEADVVVEDCNRERRPDTGTPEPTPAPTRNTPEPTPEPSPPMGFEFFSDSPTPQPVLRNAPSSTSDFDSGETLPPTQIGPVTVDAPQFVPRPTTAPTQSQITMEPSSQEQCFSSVTRFAVIDAIVDKTVSVLRQKVSYSSLSGKYLNIKAFIQVCPQSPVRSVLFKLTSPSLSEDYEFCDSRAPFALYGDTRGDYVGRILQGGVTYQITATVFNKNNCRRNALDPVDPGYTQSFTVSEL